MRRSPFPRIFVKSFVFFFYFFFCCCWLLVSIKFKMNSPKSSYANCTPWCSTFRGKRCKSVFGRDVFIISVQFWLFSFFFWFSHGFHAFIIQTSKRNARSRSPARSIAHLFILFLSLARFSFFFIFVFVFSIILPRDSRIMFFRSLHSCVHTELVCLQICHNAICTHWKESFLFQSLLFHDDVNAVVAVAIAAARYLAFSFWLFHSLTNTHIQTQTYTNDRMYAIG